jgi:hypothetical protein
MKDTTVDALDTMRADAIAEQRATIETSGETTATATGAPIYTTRALLLLFDVLVGITIGTLRHDQRYWHTVVNTATGRYRCGTYRCVAGWLVATAYPDVEPVPCETLGAVTRYSDVIIGDETRDYGEMGARALDVEVTVAEYEPCSPDCTMCRARWVSHPIDALFDPDATLVELWEQAGRLSGFAIVPPAALYELIHATRRVEATL